MIQSSSETRAHPTAPEASPTPQKATPEPAKSSIDYSRLRISDDKSFSEAFIEAVELNDQASRLKDEEQAALRSLQMIHHVSALTSALLHFYLVVSYCSSPQAPYLW